MQWDIYWYLFDERWLCNGQSFVALFFWLEQSGNHVCIGLTESAIRLAWVCLGWWGSPRYTLSLCFKHIRPTDFNGCQHLTQWGILKIQAILPPPPISLSDWFYLLWFVFPETWTKIISECVWIQFKFVVVQSAINCFSSYYKGRIKNFLSESEQKKSVISWPWPKLYCASVFPWPHSVP